MHLVLVEWRDSHFARGGWLPKEDEENTVPFVSMGVLLREDDKEIEIVPNLGKGFKSQGITVLKSCISRLRYLKVA